MSDPVSHLGDLLAAGGPIARRLPGFEVRPQQIELAAAIERAFADGRHLVAEAGTGTGKSFAYLLPAAMWADRHQGQGPVVISTRTIALQEQLEQKDLPFLHAVLPFEWSSVTAIGRNNYVCLRRMHLATREQGLFDDPDRGAELQQIVDWSVRARDGTRHELAPPPSPEVWEEVQAEHGNCLQRACKHYDQCHWQRARRRMQTAQVLVVNHSLYFADLALRIVGASYLPEHRVVIFDEAHHLERVATESLGLRLGPRTIHWHLRRLHSRRGDRSLLQRHGTPAARLLWEEVRQHNDGFFEWLTERLQSAAGGQGGLALHDEPLPEPLTPTLRALGEEVATAAIRAEQVDVRMELQARASGIESLCAILATLCRPDPRAETPLVRWLEPSRHGAILCAAPLDVSATLRQHLFGNGPTSVLVSATMGTGDDAEFRWFRQRLGLERATALQLDSPFDYDRAVEIVIEEAMPDPTQQERAFRVEAAERTARHILDNGGHALVLCTSWARHEFAERLRPRLEFEGIELLVQGEAPLNHLLAKKRDVPTSVLLGTDSLWEGIDVPGEALSLLVITRLPFQNPSPLTKARLSNLARQGKEPFADHSLPEAILKFRQGFGRLIRNEHDRGKVVILDPRVRTKAYGRRFLAALPFSPDFEGW